MNILYCSSWVLPISSGPIRDGAVAVDGDSIAGVGPAATLKRKFAGAQVSDFGEAAIIPGLVNCHSHLELTAMRGFLEREESDFKAWLMKLTVARNVEMTSDDLYVSALCGAVEAARAGVTCLGDASNSANEPMRALNAVGLRGIVYQESFGPDPADARAMLEELQAKVSALREHEESGLVRAGVSPHAPYTVSAPQLELVTDYALADNLPVMMHAAESADEASFMFEGTGPFAAGLALRGIEWRAPGISTVQYLAKLGVLRARPLLAHCIRVDQADLETLSEWDAAVAHCPKSNAKLGHGHAPFRGFLARDLRVGLGSDSVASNNLCDLLEEARFAALTSRAFDSAADATSAEEALRAATLGGARALGMEDQTGSLQEGLQADLAIVSLDHARQLPVYDPYAALVFASSARDVLKTIVAGREIYGDGRVEGVDEERLGARVREIAEKLEPRS
jgi:5-methylthioadenosine/S-adenosylhomocysteine deaminase